jgi:hypothetical protein
MGRAFFRDSVFARQASGETCPFKGPNFQLMRNFLYSAALAQQNKLPTFGVIVVAPQRKTRTLERQIRMFRDTILQPELANLIQLLTYEQLIDALKQSDNNEATELARFLSKRIAQLIR